MRRIAAFCSFGMGYAISETPYLYKKHLARSRKLPSVAGLVLQGVNCSAVLYLVLIVQPINKDPENVRVSSWECEPRASIFLEFAVECPDEVRRRVAERCSPGLRMLVPVYSGAIVTI